MTQIAQKDQAVEPSPWLRHALGVGLLVLALWSAIYSVVSHYEQNRLHEAIKTAWQSKPLDSDEFLALMQERRETFWKGSLWHLGYAVAFSIAGLVFLMPQRLGRCCIHIKQQTN